MADAVYLHIGAPKTGTTYLQRVLWQNKAALASDGVLIPGQRRFDAFNAAQAVLEVPWLDDKPPERRGIWGRMLTEIEEWTGTAILSHEFLGGASQEQAEKTIDMLASAEVHIVYTARDPALQLPALWQEAVKMGAQRPQDEYLQRVLDGTKPGPWGIRSVDTVAILERWGATLPPDRVHVVTVPPPGSPPDLLWRRFAAACHLDPDAYPLSVPPANESIGAVEVELLRRVAARLPPDLQTKQRRHRWLRRFFAHEILATRTGRRIQLPPSLGEAVQSLSKRTIAGINARGYAIEGDLADLQTGAAASLPDPQKVRQVEILRAALEVIGVLIDRQRILAEQNQSLRRQLAAERAEAENRLGRRVRRQVARVRGPRSGEN